MADTSLAILDANGVVHNIDIRSVPGGDERQVLLLGDGENAGVVSPATELTLSAILTELQGKLDAGGTIEVDNASGGPLGVKQTGVAPPLGYQQVAALTASQALPTIPAGAVTAIITPRAPVRWRDDGTAPTAGVGMYLAADQALTYQGDLAAVRLIAVTGSVEVNVAYYGAEG